MMGRYRIIQGQGHGPDLILDAEASHIELADIHNRRANIETVAKECQKHNYPLIAWPEDRELLRFEDLPSFSVDDVNQRPGRAKVKVWLGWAFADTAILRIVIREGSQYSRDGHMLIEWRTEDHDD